MFENGPKRNKNKSGRSKIKSSKSSRRNNK
jgi:hypothetical protein